MATDLRTKMSTSLRDDIVLTCEQQYRREIAAIPRITKEEVQGLITRAQTGEKSACDALLAQALHRVHSWAWRFHWAYRWATACAEYAELVSVGHLALVEALPLALRATDPWGCLLGHAKFAMIRNFTGKQDCIAITEHYMRKHGHIPVESLDRPLDEEGDLTLLDTLAAPEPVHWHRTLPVSDEQMHAALKTLTPKQQQIVARLYGLGEEMASESGAEIARDKDVSRNSIYALRDLALNRLREVLDGGQEVYTLQEIATLLGRTQRQAGYYLHSHGVAPIARGCYAKEQIDAVLAAAREKHGQAVCPCRSSQEITRLIEDACTRLQQQGRPINLSSLMREAGVSQGSAEAYLRKHEHLWTRRPTASRHGDQKRREQRKATQPTPI